MEAASTSKLPSQYLSRLMFYDVTPIWMLSRGFSSRVCLIIQSGLFKSVLRNMTCSSDLSVRRQHFVSVFKD